MPLLVKLDFIHYSPKNSEQGTKELLIANDIEQAVDYIDKECLYDYFKDGDGKEDEGSHPITDEWWTENPTKRAEAEALGLEITDYGYVNGNAEKLTRWLCSNSWKDADDAHYGVTHYDWSKQQEISAQDVAALLPLIRFGLVNDIRNWKREEE